MTMRSVYTLVHIKKVDIFGFKSFGFKNTTVNFEPGLVSISGPNGSGKSNILDAIQFALGENKWKTLRGQGSLRSLIHDIEGKKHGPKLTRVRVQFDNSDRRIPVDSDIVTITREMGVKGESEYFLDSKKTSRTRILDLLDMANAGLNQLNAVQQGTVTKISEFSGEEKRETIEELVGLAYYDGKKKESIKQLTEADQRLEIAMAKMGEVKKQIDELEIERNLKMRHDLIGLELDRFRAVAAASKLKIIKNEKTAKVETLESNLSKTRELEEERNSLKKEIDELEKQKTEFLKDFNAYNVAKSAIDTKLSGEQTNFYDSESKMKTSERRIVQINTRLHEITNEFEQMDKNQGVVDKELEKIKESIHGLNRDKDVSDKKIKNLDSKLATVLLHQSDVSDKKIEIDTKISELKNKQHDDKLLRSQNKSKKNDIQNKINTNIAKNKSRTEALTQLKEYGQKLDRIVSTCKSASIEIKSRVEQLSKQRSKIENDIIELESIFEKSSKAASHYNEKIKIVKGIMHEDYTISQLKGDAKKLGIEGLVYEILSWDKQYEHAILAVSSDWLKAMVVPDFETLVSLAQAAREKNLPKLKIIPLNAIPEFNLKMPKTSGLLGVLSDYINCDRRYMPIARFLFGNVILTKTREDAYNISKVGYMAVSIDGEFFKSKSSAVVVDINSKISKLAKIISQSSSVEGLIQSITLLRSHIHAKKSSIRKIDQRLQYYMKKLQISETEFGNAFNDSANLKFKIDSASKVYDESLNRNSELTTQKNSIDTRIIQLSSSLESIKQRITIVSENYSNVEQKRVANEITLLNTSKASLISENTRIHTQLTESVAKISVVENRKKLQTRALLEEQSSLDQEKTDCDNIIKECKDKKDASEQILIKLRQEEQDLISTSGRSTEQLNEFDGKLSERNTKVGNITKQTSNLERGSDMLERDLKSIKSEESSLEKILGSFGFDALIETFDVQPFIQALEKEKNTLSTSLNAIAPQRYVQISTGYRSMSTRKNELEEERNAIWSFIEGIDKEKKQLFLDAFDTVDTEIKAIFSKMTGGNAWLELENEDEIFDSGISYYIQFPSKPKRESNSISGGEKTLAAVVFVLALQKLKPSPFYLFDEVDAHLDGPNSERLSKIVEERSIGSQFIMVSLKDSVVEKAKLIYGVFPKNGVSHVVTYKDKRLPSISN
jgi:chromosome segregation protein